MSTDTKRQLGYLTILSALLVAALAYAYVTRNGATPVSASSDGRVSAPAPIDNVDVMTLERYPAEYIVSITSGLPSGCAWFERATITSRIDNVITVSVTNTMPADEEIPCTTVYGTHHAAVSLGSTFTSGETYQVNVNGTVVEFTAQ